MLENLSGPDVAITDEDWRVIEDILRPVEVPQVSRRRANLRHILDAILWVERNGGLWKHLPGNYPPTQTCYKKYIQWRADGKLETVFALLNARGKSDFSSGRR